MSYLPPPWWRLATLYSSGWLALQRGPAAVAADAATLALVLAALRAPPSPPARTAAPRLLLRLAALANASAAVYACAAEQRRGGAVLGWPVQHAALASALGLAVSLSGALARTAATHAALALLTVMAALQGYSGVVRLAAPECARAAGVAASDVVSAAACLALCGGHALLGGGCSRRRHREPPPPPPPPPSGRPPASCYHPRDTSATARAASLDSAGWWRALSFGYLNPLIETGAARQLAMADIDAMPAACATDEWVRRLDAQLRMWRAAAATRAAGAPTGGAWELLRGVLWPLYGGAWGWLGLLQALAVGLSFAGPLVLSALLGYLENAAAPDGSQWALTAAGGLACAGAMAAQSGLSALVGTHMSYRTTLIQARIRAGLTAGVFRASLAAPVAERARASRGALLNYLSVDAQRICDSVGSVHQLWALPLQVAVTLWLLYTQVAWAALAGLAILAVFTPVNLLVSRRIGALTGVMMAARDERVRVTGEVLAGIKAVKMHAWEVPLLQRIATARSAEVAALAQRKYLDAACVFLWACTPVLMSLGTFAAVVALAPPSSSGGGGGGSGLSASTVFTTVSLLQLLIFPLNALPWVVAGMLEAAVSLTRLQRFLCVPLDARLDAPLPAEEPLTAAAAAVATASEDATAAFAASLHAGPSSSLEEEDAAIVVSLHGSFAFAPPLAASPTLGDGDGEVEAATAAASPPFTLHVELPERAGPLTVAAGETVTVLGRVGAGKSALLSALLGEMLPVGWAASDGRACPVGVRAAASYAPQVAWVRGVSLRDNIVAHEPWDAARYAHVLDACALADDIGTLAGGDTSIVSDATLSGGQQQRISLARALYSHSRVLLLDDPISALDARVGAHVWVRALGRGAGSLLAQQGRARVIVTHDTRFAADADRVVVMDAGRLVFVGPPAAVPQHLAAHLAGSLHGPVPVPDEGRGEAQAALHAGAAQATRTPAPPAAPHKPQPDEGAQAAHDDDGDTERVAEGREEGVIKSRVLRLYLVACGVGLAGVVFASLAGMQLTRNGSDWWLSVWSAASSGAGSSSPLDAPLIARLAALGWGARQYLTVFGVIVAANALTTAVRSWSFARACLNAAVSVHDRLVAAVVRAPMAFHDVTSAGRLLNRFSADQFAIDDSLPFLGNILLANTIGMAGTILVLTYATTGVFLVALPVLASLYFSLQRTYRASSREIKRLDSVSRSPLYAHFSDCVAGAAVIRAQTLHRPHPWRALEREAGTSSRCMDDNQRTSFTSAMASQWLSLRLQGIGTLLLAAVATAVVLLRVLTDAGAAASPGADCFEDVDPPAGGAGLHAAGAAAQPPSRELAAGLVLGALVAAASSASSAGAAGLALSYSIPIVGALNGLLNIFAEVEKELISVERAQEYIDVAPEEPAGEATSGGALGSAAAASGGAVAAAATAAAGKDALGGAGDAPGSGTFSDSAASPLLAGEAGDDATRVLVSQSLAWRLGAWRPSRGRIEFVGLTVRYPGTTRPALDGLTLSISTGDKVALRGRTGSGKSTVLAALWRLMSWEAGTILIDGTDIRTVPLPVLRASLAIIPQEPVLLQGTVRYNLDPAGYHTDERMRAALARCRLSCALDCRVDEGGANFSAGERQLLCLARALLSDSRVVCVDEATASTDAATDALVNEVLHSAFSAATLLVIAHRESGVGRCRRVVTLDGGRLQPEQPYRAGQI